jgi:uncharacterized protein YaaQ
VKLVIAVVQGEDAQRAAAALTDAGLVSTRVATSDGFLQQGKPSPDAGASDGGAG